MSLSTAKANWHFEYPLRSLVDWSATFALHGVTCPNSGNLRTRYPRRQPTRTPGTTRADRPSSQVSQYARPAKATAAAAQVRDGAFTGTGEKSETANRIRRCASPDLRARHGDQVTSNHAHRRAPKVQSAYAALLGSSNADGEGDVATTPSPGTFVSQIYLARCPAP